eukprot:4094631-Alexandrium_andersonii.AAC.1
MCIRDSLRTTASLQRPRAHAQSGAVRRRVHLGGLVDVVILGRLIPSSEGRRFEVHVPRRKNSSTTPPRTVDRPPQS